MTRGFIFKKKYIIFKALFLTEMYVFYSEMVKDKNTFTYRNISLLLILEKSFLCCWFISSLLNNILWISEIMITVKRLQMFGTQWG